MKKKHFKRVFFLYVCVILKQKSENMFQSVIPVCYVTDWDKKKSTLLCVTGWVSQTSLTDKKQTRPPVLSFLDFIVNSNLGLLGLLTSVLNMFTNFTK